MTRPDRIRVLLVDDHDMVRRGLATFLQIFDDLLLAGEAASGAEALRACAEARPDVVLMDLMMPDMDGPTATQAIKARFPRVQVIGIAPTDLAEPELMQRVLQAGANSCLPKDAGADELHAAIRAAHAGRSTAG